MTMSNESQASQTEVLPSGVKIIHTQIGTGPSPTAADTVKVHYRGTLADGKEFDSSYKRNAPISFPLRGVIPAWTQGVQKMKVGGKATLICPPDTAYGARGVPGVIPPGATLTFDIELLAIEK
jgi:FKBP-type peptidyl-prolyl cis-trans isomerase FkpA